MIIQLIDIEAYNPATASVVTLRYCTGAGAYLTGPDETPAAVAYLPRVINPGNFRRDLFAPGTTSGSSRISAGTVVLNNADGGLDFLLRFGLDGRRITIREGLHSSTIDTFETVLIGTMEQPELNFKQFTIRLRDRQAELAKPVQTTLYAGSNVLPDGLEGTADIKDRPKPLTYGAVFNATPICVNTSRLVYQIHDGAISDIPHAYDNGLELKRQVDALDIVTPLSLATTAQAHLYGCYSPVSGKCYWAYGSTVRVIDTTDDSETTVALSGVGTTISGMCYDPDNECLWIMSVSPGASTSAWITRLLTADNSYTTTTMAAFNDHQYSGVCLFYPTIIHPAGTGKIYTTHWGGTAEGPGDLELQRRDISAVGTVEHTHTISAALTLLLPSGHDLLPVRKQLMSTTTWVAPLGLFIFTYFRANVAGPCDDLWLATLEPDTGTVTDIMLLNTALPPYGLNIAELQLAYIPSSDLFYVLITQNGGFSYLLVFSSVGGSFGYRRKIQLTTLEWLSNMAYHAASDCVYFISYAPSAAHQYLFRMTAREEISVQSSATNAAAYSAGTLVPVGKYLYSPLNAAAPIKVDTLGNILLDYADQAELIDDTLQPWPGYYRVCPSLGMFRVGSVPQGITCDVLEGAAAADRTAGQAWHRMATERGGLLAADLEAASVADLDTLNTAVVGIHVSDTRNCDECLSEIAGSVGAWWGFNQLGIAGIYRLDAPAGVPVFTIEETVIRDLKRLASNDTGRGVPAWRVVLRYARNYTVQTDGQLAGDTSAERRQWVTRDLRSVSSESAGVKTAHLLAPDLSFDSLLTAEADAVSESSRRLGMYAAARDMLEASLSIRLAGLQPGQLVELVHSRFGYQEGRLFRVIGIVRDFAGSKYTAILWG